ncbi:hypothetical protein ES703_102149 [subsurface metagenome]
MAPLPVFWMDFTIVSISRGYKHRISITSTSISSSDNFSAAFKAIGTIDNQQAKVTLSLEGSASLLILAFPRGTRYSSLGTLLLAKGSR